MTAVITDQGRSLLEQVLPGHIALVQRGVFDPLDDSQTEALADALTVVRNHRRSLVPTSAERRRS